MTIVDGVAERVFGKYAAPAGSGGVAVAAVVRDLTGLSFAGSVAPAILDEHTLFSIGSIAKALTGTLLAEMVLSSELGLDDPLSSHLAELDGSPAASITVGELATHRAGLPLRPPSCDANPPISQYDGVTRETVLADLRSFSSPPGGAGFEYSNFGFAALGQVLERVGGADWAKLVRRRVLDPLGMAETAVLRDPAKSSNVATGVGKRGQPIPHRDVSGLTGAGGLYSNATDMAKLLAACIDPPDLPVGRALSLAMTPRASTDEASDGNSRFIGLGWRIVEIPSVPMTVVWHNGHGPGNHSFIGVVPEHRVALVAMANHHHSTDFDRAAIGALAGAVRAGR